MYKIYNTSIEENELNKNGDTPVFEFESILINNKETDLNIPKCIHAHTKTYTTKKNILIYNDNDNNKLVLDIDKASTVQLITYNGEIKTLQEIISLVNMINNSIINKIYLIIKEKLVLVTYNKNTINFEAPLEKIVELEPIKIELHNGLHNISYIENYNTIIDKFKRKLYHNTVIITFKHLNKLVGYLIFVKVRGRIDIIDCKIYNSYADIVKHAIIDCYNFDEVTKINVVSLTKSYYYTGFETSLFTLMSLTDNVYFKQAKIKRVLYATIRDDARALLKYK